MQHVNNQSDYRVRHNISTTNPIARGQEKTTNQTAARGSQVGVCSQQECCPHLNTIHIMTRHPISLAIIYSILRTYHIQCQQECIIGISNNSD